MPGANVTESLSTEGEGEVGSTPILGLRNILPTLRSLLYKYN